MVPVGHSQLGTFCGSVSLGEGFPVGTALQRPGRTGLGTAAVPIPCGVPRTAQWDAPGHPHGALVLGWGHPATALWEVVLETPTPHLGLPFPPEHRDAQRDTSAPPPDHFCGTLWLQAGVSTPCYPHQTAQGWGRGCSGGNGPQNPGAELHMKHSGHSVRFPLRHQQHHQYCRWALKFHSATLCAACGHGPLEAPPRGRGTPSPGSRPISLWFIPKTGGADRLGP